MPDTHFLSEPVVDDSIPRGSNDLLPLLADEPVLGPLVREFAVIDEIQGNLAGEPAHPEWDQLLPRWRELDTAIATCSAQTIGGVAWRLGEVCLRIADEDISSTWIVSALQKAFEDAKALAEASAQKCRPSAVRGLIGEFSDISAAHTRAMSAADEALFSRYPDPHTRPDEDNLPADLSALYAESDRLEELMDEAYDRVIAEPCGSLDDVIAKLEWSDAGGDTEEVLEAITPDLRRLDAAS